MRLFVLFFLALLAVCSLASPLPDKFDLELQRPPRTPQFIKGQKTKAPNPLNLRKGEYICGNTICKLKPGEIPPNCGNECQYRLPF